MTRRLYYVDSYLREFTATILESPPGSGAVYLDQTAFYPASGGQPHDLGTVNGVAVTAVTDEGDRVKHLVAGPLPPGPATGIIDWARRFDFMQQHTGQHLLSAVLGQMFSFRTASVHFGPEASTVELETASLTPGQLVDAEIRANQVVFENRAVTVSFEHHSAVEGLRKASDREGELRIVAIDGLDRSACGGTHVRATGEIGPILLRGLEKIRGNLRIEFLCGTRAVRRARTDYDALSRIARTFSAPLDEAPHLVTAQNEQLRDAVRARNKLAVALAQRQGRELYAETASGPSGRRVYVHRAAALDDELRALAQAFTAQPGALFVALAGNSVLLAVSSDTGIHAGNRLKEALAATGGRGGGAAQLAQGSVPDPSCLDPVLTALLHQ